MGGGGEGSKGAIRAVGEDYLDDDELPWQVIGLRDRRRFETLRRHVSRLPL